MLFEVEDRAAVLTVNRERCRNALDDATLLKLKAVLRECAERGVGAQAFRFGSFVAPTDRVTVALAKRLMTFGAEAPTRAARHLEYLADRSQSASQAFYSAFKGFGKKDG